MSVFNKEVRVLVEYGQCVSVSVLAPSNPVCLRDVMLWVNVTLATRHNTDT